MYSNIVGLLSIVKEILFSLEIPVIFSNLDGVKPVYGENAMKYIDPLNINEIASAIKDIKEARRIFAYTLNNILKSTNLDVDYPEWENTLTDKTLYDKSNFFVSGL